MPFIIQTNMDDAFYRYRRRVRLAANPPLRSGITVITNMDAIVRDINFTGLDTEGLKSLRDALIRFMQRKLNTRVVDKPNSSEVHVSGSYNPVELDAWITRFVSEKLTCTRCDVPEWLGRACRACGHSTK